MKQRVKFTLSADFTPGSSLPRNNSPHPQQRCSHSRPTCGPNSRLRSRLCGHQYNKNQEDPSQHDVVVAANSNRESLHHSIVAVVSASGVNISGTSGARKVSICAERGKRKSDKAFFANRRSTGSGRRCRCIAGDPGGAARYTEIAGGAHGEHSAMFAEK